MNVGSDSFDCQADKKLFLILLIKNQKNKRGFKGRQPLNGVRGRAPAKSLIDSGAVFSD
jgi:hypothetical protein